MVAGRTDGAGAPAPPHRKEHQDMAEDKQPYGKYAMAVAIGILLGALVSSDAEEVSRLKRRIATLEAAAKVQVVPAPAAAEAPAAAAPAAEAQPAEAAAEAPAEAAAEAPAAAEAAPAAAEAAPAAAEAAPAAVEAAPAAAEAAPAAAAAEPAAAEAAPSAAEAAPAPAAAAAPAAAPAGNGAMKALEDRVNVLADQMGRLATSLLDGSMPVPDAAGAAPAAAPTPTEPGETGMLLAVGDTGVIGDKRLFVSRVDAARDAVRVMVVGEGPRMIGKGFGPLDLGNGCTVNLKGVVDRQALIIASCK
jgi:hypothetical protein